MQFLIMFWQILRRQFFTHYSNPCTSEQPFTRTSCGWGFATRWRARTNPYLATLQIKHKIRAGGCYFQGGTPGSNDTAWSACVRAQQQLVLDNFTEGQGKGQGSLSEKLTKCSIVLFTNKTCFFYIPCFPSSLLKNELSPCSPHSQPHFPSQQAENTDEQVPVSLGLVLLPASNPQSETNLMRSRISGKWAGRDPATIRHHTEGDAQFFVTFPMRLWAQNILTRWEELVCLLWGCVT